MKNWLRKKNRPSDPKEGSLTVDELVALGRGDEARKELEAKLRDTPRDRRSLLKLADVLLSMQRTIDAVEIYEAAAKGLATDGFHDKAIAVLRKVLKVAPDHEGAILGIEQLEQAKRLEAKRHIVDLHMRKNSRAEGRNFDSLMLSQLWRNLSKCPLVRSLDTQSLSRLFAEFKLKELAPHGELVARKDDLEALFVVVDGKIEVIQKRADGPPIILRSYEAGDMFGENALLERRPWSAAHRAAVPTKLLCLDRDGLSAILPGLSDPREFLDTLRIQRHDSSLAAMLRQQGERR